MAAAAADHHHHNDPAVEGSPGPGAAGSAASTSTAAANITHQPYVSLALLKSYSANVSDVAATTTYYRVNR